MSETIPLEGAYCTKLSADEFTNHDRWVVRPEYADMLPKATGLATLSWGGDLMEVYVYELGSRSFRCVELPQLKVRYEIPRVEA